MGKKVITVEDGKSSELPGTLLVQVREYVLPDEVERARFVRVPDAAPQLVAEIDARWKEKVDSSYLLKALFKKGFVPDPARKVRIAYMRKDNTPWVGKGEAESQLDLECFFDGLKIREDKVPYLWWGLVMIPPRVRRIHGERVKRADLHYVNVIFQVLRTTPTIRPPKLLSKAS
jgi:hypothetical protein